MFEMLDLLVGFVVVMLVVSMAVTLLTQIYADARNLRGQALRSGIAELLLIVDRPAMAQMAEKIADHLLRDPLISQPPRLPLPRRVGQPRREGLGQVIQREELTRLLLVFAAPDDYPQQGRGGLMNDSELDGIRRRFAACLKENGIDSPRQLLETIRDEALKLELTQPALSNSERVNTAILTHGASGFVGKVNGWFDQTIDRVRDNFTLKTRAVTFFAALIVAVFLQLDAVALINRLSTDDAARTALVEWAIKNEAKLDPATPGADPAAFRNEAFKAVQANGLIAAPGSVCKWWAGWTADPEDGAGTRNVSYWGVLLSILLLSLGGPFWYEALKNLLKMRSVLAGKDDVQRGERQTNTTLPPTITLPPARSRF